MRSAIIAFLATCCLPIRLVGQAGALDMTFGNGGYVTTSFGPVVEEAKGVVVQPDGRVVAVGYENGFVQRPVVVARYLSNGVLDPAFGSGGWTSASYPGFDYGEARSVALQSDGRIVTAGFVSTFLGAAEFSAARFNTDGTLDTAFDGDGLVNHGFGVIADHRGSGMALHTDGRIVVAGKAMTGVGGDIGVMRLNTDGSLDTLFDGDGLLTLDLGGPERVEAVAVRSDGRTVVVGTQDTISFVVQLELDGSLDSTFGINGVVLMDLLEIFQARSVCIRPDGKLLVGGSAYGLGLDFAVMRLNADGSVDTGFGTGGGVQYSFDLTSFNDYGQCMALQPDGRILLAGHLSDIVTDVYGVIRLEADGSFDQGFATGGVGRYDLLPLANERAYAMALQADGGVILAGSIEIGPQNDFVVLRINGGVSVGRGEPTVEYAPVIAPNPSDGVFRIQGASVRSLVAFDPQGRELPLTWDHANDQVVVRVHGSPGLYMLRITDMQGGTTVERFQLH